MIRNRAAFTLIELLVVIAVVAVLIGLFFTLGSSAIKRSQATASLNNMRQVGVGFIAFANDNDFLLPRRVEGPEGGDHWPVLLLPYLGNDKKVYADPGDPKNFLRTHQDPLSNQNNHTSYIMNGFNDRGTFENDQVTTKLTSIEQPSNTVLLGPSGMLHFYMDENEGNLEDGTLDKKAMKTAAGEGSNYLFADGSARFILKKDCTSELWLTVKTARTN